MSFVVFYFCSKLNGICCRWHLRKILFKIHFQYISIYIYFSELLRERQSAVVVDMSVHMCCRHKQIVAQSIVWRPADECKQSLLRIALCDDVIRLFH